jgi:hypothetical protein
MPLLALHATLLREMEYAAQSSSLVDDVTVFAFEFGHRILRPSECAREMAWLTIRALVRGLMVLWFGARWHGWQFSTAFFIDTDDCMPDDQSQGRCLGYFLFVYRA